MADSLLEGSPHDLIDDDARLDTKIYCTSNVDRGAVSEGKLDHDADSKAADSIQEDHSSLRGDALTIYDVSPIEAARERLLYIVVDHFITRRIVEVSDSEADNASQNEQDNPHKRKSREARYEGDSQYANPLLYVANIYETLVNEVNARLASLDSFLEKTIGVDLEAARGLYRRLAEKFPVEGPFAFKRREVTTLAEAGAWFLESGFSEEKGVHFVVVNGLDIVEKPSTLLVADREWFKRLTGRSEVSIDSRDYLFYAPKQKYQHLVSNPLPSSPDLPKKKLSSCIGNTPPKTQHAQPAIGSSSAQALGQSHGNSAAPSSSRKPSNYVKQPYLHEVPNFMFPYIDSYEDFAFGQSGFQAIAYEVGLGDTMGWCGVRRDLFLELMAEPDRYSQVFTDETKKKILKALAVWTIPAALLPEHQLSIPDMGHIVATMYQAAFVVLGQQCVTFLPLNVGMRKIGEICIVFLHHQNRFISVTLNEYIPSPLPPIHPLWYRHHDSSADGLDLHFADRIQQFEWCQSFMA